ncbi:DNA ligase 1-like [Mytilus edulis]|uniref:DNA ligase 1-like n=1 Tax=Mytilus edulis TaxID=6550 RepID=UPI0039EEB443
MDMSSNFKDDKPNQQDVVKLCRGIISVAQFELALERWEQLEESIKVAEAREAELAKELGRYRYGDKFDEKEMSIFSREFSPAKQSVAEFKFTLNEFECIARSIKESEEKDTNELLKEDLKKTSDETGTEDSEIVRTTSNETGTEDSEIVRITADETGTEDSEIVRITAYETGTEDSEIVRITADEIGTEDSKIVRILPADETGTEDSEIVRTTSNETSTEDSGIVRITADETGTEDSEIVRIPAYETDTEDSAIVRITADETGTEDSDIVRITADETGTEDSEIVRMTADETGTEADEMTDLRTLLDQNTCTISPDLMIPKRRGQIIAVNPFITRNLINFKYRETNQPSLLQKQNEQIEKEEILKTKKETKLEKKRVREEEMIFKKYLKVANRRMKQYKKESRKQLEKEEKENKKKVKREQKERASLEMKEMKDRKKLEKGIKKKGETKEENNVVAILEHMDIAMQKNKVVVVDFRDDRKGIEKKEEKKNTICKIVQDVFRYLICAKK